jgi:hypothetical protein
LCLFYNASREFYEFVATIDKDYFIWLYFGRGAYFSLADKSRQVCDFGPGRFKESNQVYHFFVLHAGYQNEHNNEPSLFL